MVLEFEVIIAAKGGPTAVYTLQVTEVIIQSFVL